MEEIKIRGGLFDLQSTRGMHPGTNFAKTTNISRKNVHSKNRLTRPYPFSFIHPFHNKVKPLLHQVAASPLIPKLHNFHQKIKLIRWKKAVNLKKKLWGRDRRRRPVRRWRRSGQNVYLSRSLAPAYLRRPWKGGFIPWPLILILCLAFFVELFFFKETVLRLVKGVVIGR